jgi:hypothetical protein
MVSKNWLKKCLFAKLSQSLPGSQEQVSDDQVLIWSSSLFPVVSGARPALTTAASHVENSGLQCGLYSGGGGGQVSLPYTQLVVFKALLMRGKRPTTKEAQNSYPEAGMPGTLLQSRKGQEASRKPAVCPGGQT